ncbi:MULTISPECIES: HAMP domain-containing sensor histidine kinase [unclassified Cyanobium]|uniref:sensor histidine kinase n=1 Tax=unclassified Cyanobium TaxID=2627006 RepID=UPI0020CB8A09|nr:MULTISPECIES: HAMP domain-containing sensor histidine kinase [unclassified Cyanobium]MCP9776705.1 HAMP domain-containing histidine kinase [Cyanobium sp. Tous-M-B4]MCP9875884.1 HAMP domain-containing histidine kinase [Cyanobium sp. A2C-AMD]
MVNLAAVRYGLVGLGVALLSTLQLQLLLAERLQRDRITQQGPEVLFQLRLAELALDRLPPARLARLSGLPLRVGAKPPRRSDRALEVQAQLLRQELCASLNPCPSVLPALAPQRGVWVQLLSPLDPVWLLVPIPPVRPWPPDPWLLLVGLGLGGSVALLLFFLLEVQRPLLLLQQVLGGVGRRGWPDVQQEQGTLVVRQLTARFNAMVQRLQAVEEERAVMLAGIAHDLKSPLTRLRFRISLLDLAQADLQQADLQQAVVDLDSLERITGQFLLFAGGGDQEVALAVPLEQLLAEQAAGLAASELELDLEPLLRVVQPVALARAVANLIANARSYGAPPLRLQLRAAEPAGEGFRIVIWDCGPGIPPERWDQALMPFQRLDAARGGGGHCGLGLAIAARVARSHGGHLERLEADGDSAWRFGIALYGRSQEES